MELIRENRASPYEKPKTVENKLAAAPLFACTKCMKKFPFASLSEDKQCCPACRAASINVKCLYCQAEFEGSGTSSLCKNCHRNEKHFGKPKACEWCNMLSAFNKSAVCARCKHYSSKHGSPVPCERCKRECAFDRQEEKKKVGNKILCWSCMQAFRRKKTTSNEDINGNRKRPLSMDAYSSATVTSVTTSKISKPSTELLVTESLKSLDATPEYPFSSNNRSSSRDLPADNFMLISELRDKVSLLEKQLIARDSDLLNRDKQIAELKTEISVNEQQFRTRVQSLQRTNSEQMQQLASKSREISQLQKQLNSIKKDKKSA